MKCIQKSCPKGGVTKIDDHLEALSSSEDITDQNMLWYPLGNSSGQYPERKRSEKESLHLFRAAWQGNQFSTLRAHTPEGWVIQVLDFAENFAIINQDEVSSAHWHHEQVTVHPIVYATTDVSTVMMQLSLNHWCS